MGKDLSFLYENCELCPRRCHVDRTKGQAGYCRETSSLMAARASLHEWEEPCISGTCGSGTVFFSGCNMGCVFCQNYEIAHAKVQKQITSEHLSEIFLRLQDRNASNINLVTPTHFMPTIVNALERARDNGLIIPVVYNTSGYETADKLKYLDGLIDIYLPDFKYFSSDISKKYSNATDYSKVCLGAIKEMVRQTGNPVFFAPKVQPSNISCKEKTMTADEYNDYVTGELIDDYCGPLMKKGTIVRHMMLPGNLEDSKKIVFLLHEHFQDNIFISLMNQYTPMPYAKEYKELTKKVGSAEYEALVDYAIEIGVNNAFIQGDETALDSFIPEFDFRGL